MPAKRISFNQRDAAHIYEYLCMYWTNDPDPYSRPAPFGGCCQCQQLAKRLEKLLGHKEAKSIQLLVKQFPGRGAKR